MTRVFTILLGLLVLTACGKTEESEKTAQAQAVPIAQQEAELILVTGVTGRQGGATARALLETGYRVRGLTRNPLSERAQGMAALGVEMVKGDFNDKQSLEAAMQGAKGVFLVTNFWEHGYQAEVQQGKNVVDVALATGIAHLVFSSVANADDTTGVPHFDSKYEVEEYIESSGIDYTIIRPVSFMENWESSKDKVLAGKIARPFSLSTRVQLISVRDIGRFAAQAFSKPEDWKGRALDIAGEDISMKELVNLFSVVTGSPVEYVRIPWDEFELAEGEEMTIMDKWIEEVGYSANVNLVRSELPGMWSLEDYLEQAGW